MSHQVVQDSSLDTSGTATQSVEVTYCEAPRRPGEEPIVARDCAGHNPGMYALAESSPFIKGVVSLRGLMVPVFDLKVRFKDSEAHQESPQLCMASDAAGSFVGAVPDEAGAVIELQGVAIDALPGAGGEDERGPITGIGLVERADKPGTLILAYIRQKAPGIARLATS